MPQYFDKDPSAVLDYKWDWATYTNQGTGTDWLESGETITTATVTADTGLTVASSAKSDNDTSVVAWLSGGTHNVWYEVVCQIVTSAGRTDERTVVIRVAQR